MKLSPANLSDLDFSKSPDGLLPAIVQDINDDRVLMLGYVNLKSLETSYRTEHVTFFSRSKNRLWTKGETSGNYLDFIEAYTDCDRDAVLIFANPNGPTCHTGKSSCFDEEVDEVEAFAKTDDDADDYDDVEDLGEFGFLRKLEDLLHEREADANSESYTSRLLAKGTMKIAQKVGEEGVEMALEAVGGTDELFTEEAADLLYHYLLLLRVKGQKLTDVVKVLEQRHQ